MKKEAQTSYLSFKSGEEWRNWHKTEGIGGNVQRLYTPHNFWTGKLGTKTFHGLPGLAALQHIVQEAEKNEKRVRAVGSGWSMSSAAFTDEYLVNTARLNNWFIGFQTPAMLEEPYKGRRNRIVFAQCGVQIKTLNTHLEQRGFALPTSGASNGQTIVGATSTGTHGSNLKVGAMQDFLLGIHIVAESGKHYWIQRASAPAVTQQFCDWLGAEQKRDDDLFKAAIVGIGSFGLVHAVLFEASPIYFLDRFVHQHDFRVVQNAISTLNINDLGLPEADEFPSHFEVVLNPYCLDRGEGGAFVRVYYKREVAKSLPIPTLQNSDILLSEDLVSAAGRLFDAQPDFIPGLLMKFLKEDVKPTEGKCIRGTLGQQFSDSSPTGGGTSVEIGVPLKSAGSALDAILEVTGTYPFPAPLAFRYVKASEAFLAFTCFPDITCTIEIPGPNSERSRDAHQRIFKALRERDIPHTFHWGQSLPLDPDWVCLGFGKERVNNWLAARSNFLSPKGRYLFANSLIDTIGLA